MVKIKSQRSLGKGGKVDPSLSTNDDDDDFDFNSATVKKVKNGRKKNLSDRSKNNQEHKNVKETIIDLLKQDVKQRESRNDRLFNLEVQRALELSRIADSQSATLLETKTTEDNTFLEMPSLISDEKYEIINQNKSAKSKAEDFVKNEKIDCNISDLENTSPLKANNNLDQLYLDAKKNIQTHLISRDDKNQIPLIPIVKPYLNNDCNLLSNHNHRNSVQLSPLQGTLRLGLSRNSKVKSLHIIK